MRAGPTCRHVTTPLVQIHTIVRHVKCDQVLGMRRMSSEPNPPAHPASAAALQERDDVGRRLREYAAARHEPTNGHLAVQAFNSPMTWEWRRSCRARRARRGN